MGEGAGAVGHTGLDQRGDACPVGGALVVACEEAAFPLKSQGPDEALDGVGVHPDAAIVAEYGEAPPVVGEISRALHGGNGANSAHPRSVMSLA